MKINRKHFGATLSQMTKASGIAVILPNGRMATFLECVADERVFAEPVVDFQHSRNVPLVCFVIAGEIGNRNITHIGFGRRGMRAGTNLRRLNIKKTKELIEPISIQKLLDDQRNRNAASVVTSVEKRFLSGGLFTDKGFESVVESIRRLSPQAFALIKRFNEDRTSLIEKLSENTKNNLAQQKEALLTAMSIAGVDRSPIQEWTLKDEKPISFLDGLPNARLREDQMVINDLSKIPGFSSVRDGMAVTGVAVFESLDTGERLTVILANRLPLEEQTGVDLIYFNETYQSFVMVQYKAMEHAQRKSGTPFYVYRLPDTQLKAEIDRMDAMLCMLNACESNADIGGFRLTENPFFIKLCPRIVFNPDDVSLVKGMYLPLDYWKRLENDPGIKGPKGGLRITYDNAKRHFDNTSFTTMVSKAWVGTTPNQSQVLHSIIRETLKTGKAVAIAIKPKKSAEYQVNDEEIEDEVFND